MKKILYLILLLPFFSLQSCVEDEKDIFDASAAERIAAAMKEYRATLAAAENGWLLAYYPEKNHSIGGYNMMAKFTAEGNVTLSSEVATRNYEAGDTLTSQYDIISDMGPVLTFNTYNEILHHFTEPNGSSDVDGMAGDYEFVFMDVKPDKIILKGKKYDNKLVMTRLEEPTDPKTYYKSILDKMVESSLFGGFYLFVNDDTLCIANIVDRTMRISYEDRDEKGDTIVESESLAFIYTPTGFKLYEPFEYIAMDMKESVTMENFEWNSEKKSFVCTDAGVNVVFEGYVDPNFELYYEDYLGEWTCEYTAGSTKRSVKVQVVEEVKNKSVRLKGLTFDILMNYDAVLGRLIFYGQRVGTWNGASVDAASWQVTSPGNLNTSSNYGMVTSWNRKESPMVLTWEDRGTWQYKVLGFILWANGGEYKGGGDSRFAYISMER